MVDLLVPQDFQLDYNYMLVYINLPSHCCYHRMHSIYLHRIYRCCYLVVLLHIIIVRDILYTQSRVF